MKLASNSFETAYDIALEWRESVATGMAQVDSGSAVKARKDIVVFETAVDWVRNKGGTLGTVQRK